MLQVNHNGILKKPTELCFYKNRGFEFGDGIFETIIVSKNEIRHISKHKKRLLSGLKAINLHGNQIDWDSEIHKVLRSNNVSRARIKLSCWRTSSDKPGYGSDASDLEFLITPYQLDSLKIKYISSVEQLNSVQLAYSIYSKCKSLSALPYVLAAIERDNKGLDEVILTDNDRNIAECSSSNLFWIKNDQLFTPPLSTGCIDGVMRSVISESIGFTESEIKYEELDNVQAMFSTNVAQLTIFNTFKSQKLDFNHPVIESIKPLWEL